jgi:hypothetical protein
MFVLEIKEVLACDNLMRCESLLGIRSSRISRRSVSGYKVDLILFQKEKLKY